MTAGYTRFLSTPFTIVATGCVMLALITLTGCGQTGPLYLPESAQQPPSAQTSQSQPLLESPTEEPTTENTSKSTTVQQ
ncbi:LPS translocon maturation chaperone LptM [Marinibactrum halimedae]|uniref:Lipoprotein n=1 Tax=Marinibactrum halimedae TaxID=1444977 RepID=A0AA37WM96_9GAMM|nr:lipoprotein [Marinibactrum halimedae]MCD9458294.1 lipoprotein [Marinibactrum halimedae]GLS27079.1 hypothetical protein GCM10007877_27980 [Marinibactrum halimedae]